MKLEILKRNKRIEIERLLEKNFGIKIPFKYQLLQSGKDKLRIFTGNLGPQELSILNKLLTIETIGLYFAFFKDQKLRLNFDAASLLGKETKKFVILTDPEARKWLMGEDLKKDIKNIEPGAYIIIKHNQDILGCGKITSNGLLNFVPKEKRVINRR